MKNRLVGAQVVVKERTRAGSVVISYTEVAATCKWQFDTYSLISSGCICL